jgi:hypothetical protein
MKKSEVLNRLCALSTLVMDKKFHSHFPADCFCGGNISDPTGFAFDEKIIEYIENAVRKALKADYRAKHPEHVSEL